jgi:hypothetical protein
LFIENIKAKKQKSCLKTKKEMKMKLITNNLMILILVCYSSNEVKSSTLRFGGLVNRSDHINFAVVNKSLAMIPACSYAYANCRVVEVHNFQTQVVAGVRYVYDLIISLDAENETQVYSLNNNQGFMYLV